MGVVFLGVAVLFAAYLASPNPFISSQVLPDFPRDAPIVVDSTDQCKAESTYVTEEQVGYSDVEIIDARCAGLQRDLVDAGDEGNVERVRQLIRDGGNVNSPGWPTNNGNGLIPAWSRAISNKKIDVVKLLLDSGVDVNSSYSCCANHSSMIMVAISAHDLDTTKLLIARGADLNFVGDFEWGVMDFAESSESEEIRTLVFSSCYASFDCRVRTRARRVGLFVGLLEDLSDFTERSVQPKESIV